MVEKKELEDLGRNMTFADSVMAMKDAMTVAYPHCKILVFGEDYHLDPEGKPQRQAVITKTGEAKDIEHLCLDLAHSNEYLLYMCRNVTLDYFANMDVNTITSQYLAELHDSILDYARTIGKNVNDFEYCRDMPRWHDKLSKEVKTAGKVKTYDDGKHIIGQKVPPAFLEAHITEVKKELDRLLKMRDPSTQIVMLEAEIKRLRRAGSLSEVKEKELEIQKILQKKANKQRAIENLKKAREAKAEKRRRREQQERDRNRQQPNFAKMAKQKRQKIAARKAEKRKKSAGGE